MKNIQKQIRYKVIEESLYKLTKYSRDLKMNPFCGLSNRVFYQVWDKIRNPVEDQVERQVWDQIIIKMHKRKIL